MTVSRDGKTFDINKTQEVGSLLNANKAQSNEVGRKATDDCYNRVASIPAIIIAKWLLEDNLDIYHPDHAKRLKQKLNDPEWLYLRTNEMRL